MGSFYGSLSSTIFNINHYNCNFKKERKKFIARRSLAVEVCVSGVLLLGGRGGVEEAFKIVVYELNFFLYSCKAIPIVVRGRFGVSKCPNKST